MPGRTISCLASREGMNFPYGWHSHARFPKLLNCFASLKRLVCTENKQTNKKPKPPKEICASLLPLCCWVLRTANVEPDVSLEGEPLARLRDGGRRSAMPGRIGRRPRGWSGSRRSWGVSRRPRGSEGKPCVFPEASDASLALTGLPVLNIRTTFKE